jgi:thiamine-phosphate pyrophosphorylase
MRVSDPYPARVPDTTRTLRAQLGDARLLLIFTPEVVCDGDPMERLAALLPYVDIVQVRPKPVASEQASGLSADPPAEARATFEWTERVLELVKHADLEEGARPLVMVNDRVDVAMALADAGCAGVHLGESDLPPKEARAMLPEGLLIGLSTHDMAGVVRSHDEPVDYLGFGPVFASQTKGYSDARGPERAWVASEAASVPVFAIGGITPANAGELESVGRVAVASALLSAEDPAAEAESLRAALSSEQR